MNSSDQTDQRGEILSEERGTFGEATDLENNGIEVSSLEVEKNWSRSQKEVETGSTDSLEVSESGGHVSERESDPSIALVENIQNEEDDKVLETVQGNHIVKQENVSPLQENAVMNQELFDIELPNDSLKKSDIGEATSELNIEVDETIEKESSTQNESTTELTDVSKDNYHQPVGSNNLKESKNSSNQLEELLDDDEKPYEVVEIISGIEPPIFYTQIQSKDTKGDTKTNQENTEESDTENICLTITLDNVGIEATSEPVVEVYNCNEETVRQIKEVLEKKENEPITIIYNDQENRENVAGVDINKSIEDICDVQGVSLPECIIDKKSQILLEKVTQNIQDEEDPLVLETKQGTVQMSSDQSEELLSVNKMEQSNVENNSVIEPDAFIVDDQLKKENDESIDRKTSGEEINDVPLIDLEKTEKPIELLNDKTEIEPLNEAVTEFEVVEDQPEKENIEDVREQAITNPEEKQMFSEAIGVETEGNDPETNASVAFTSTRIDEPIEVIDTETLEVTQDNDNEQPTEVLEEMVQEESFSLNEEKIFDEKMPTQLEEVAENIQDDEGPKVLDSVQGAVQQSSDQSEELLSVNEMEQSNEVVEDNSVTEPDAFSTQIEPSLKMVIVDDQLKEENDESIDWNKSGEEIDVPLFDLEKTEEPIELLNDKTEIEPLNETVTEFEVVEDQPEKENIEDVKEQAITKPEEEQMSSEAIEPETNASVAFTSTRIDEPIEVIDTETLEVTQDNDNEQPTEVLEEMVQEESFSLNEEKIFDEKMPTQLEEVAENIQEDEGPKVLDSVQGAVQQSSDQPEELLSVNEMEQSNEVVEDNSVTEPDAFSTQIEPSLKMVIVDDQLKKENDERIDWNKSGEEIIDVPLLESEKTEEPIELLNDKTENEPLNETVTEFEVVEDQPEKENIEDVKEQAITKPEEDKGPETNVSIAFIPTRIDEPIEFIDSETLEATKDNDSEKPTEVSEETLEEESVHLNEEKLIFDEKLPTKLEELKVELIPVVTPQPLQNLGASSLELAAGLDNNDGIQEAIAVQPIGSPRRSGIRKPEWMRKSLVRKGSVRRFFGRKKSKRFNHDSLPATETPPQPTAPQRPLRKIISDFFLMLFES